MATPKQRIDLEAFLNNSSEPYYVAIQDFMCSCGLINWSQRPVNLNSSNENVYRLCQPGDTSFLYTECFGDDVCQVIPLDNNGSFAPYPQNFELN